jgi:uncharacterized protein YbaR (Trm112 family)
MIDEKLLAILACPLCDERPPFKLVDSYLICTVCGHGFPIVDDIPHLLPESALSPQELESKLHGNQSA